MCVCVCSGVSIEDNTSDYGSSYTMLAIEEDSTQSV